MHKLSDITGPTSNSKTSGYYGDSTETFTGKKSYKNLIKKANSVSMIKIFNHYGFRLDDQNRKMICPFPSHKGGRENSPSFYFYSQTNSFWCFGCKIGVKCCDFVSSMDGISKIKAASKILELSDYDNDVFILSDDDENFSDKLEIMLDFSNSIRDFRYLNVDDKSEIFCENICKVYDAINLKHKLNNDALRFVVDQLKEKINSYML